MSKKSFIDSVEVKSPCTEDWEKMHGNDRVRFCDHCAKDVKNLSAVTRKEAMRLVRASGGNLCIRYIAHPVTKRPLFADQMLQITRRTPGLAAGVISASLTLSTMAYSQEETPTPTPFDEIPAIVVNQDATEVSDNAAREDQNAETDPSLGSIEGTIWDSDGKPVPDVQILLIDAESPDDVDYEMTDENGHYLFKEVEAGVYLLRVRSANNSLKKAMPEVTLAEGQKMVQNLHVILTEPSKDDQSEGGYGYGGAMAMVPYSLPLSEAVASNDIEMVRQVLASGAAVNDKDKNYDDITPLFLAVEAGNLSIVRLLLQHGADVNARDKTARTPLMFMDGDATAELVELLLRAGANISARDEDGNTVLLQTIGSLSREALGVVLEGGVDVNRPDNVGETALMKAAEQNKLDMVKALIIAGADINARNEAGESAWDKTSSAEIEDYLTQFGAATNYGNITIERRSKVADEQADD